METLNTQTNNPRIPTHKSLGVLKSSRNHHNQSARKFNQLNAKVKTFRINYAQSINRQRAQTQKQKLAQSIYTKGLLLNQLSTTQKNPETSLANLPNTEELQAKYKSLITTQLFATSYPVFNKLNKQTMNLVQFNKNITQLNTQKAQLLQKIEQYKRKIMQQKKISNKLQMNSSRYLNNVQSKYYSTSKNVQQRQRVNFCIDTISLEINNLSKQNAQFEQQNNNVKNKIQSQKKQILYLSTYVKKAKKGVIIVQKQLAQLKSDLTAALKAMQHSSFNVMQLQNQKAEVLLFINQSVKQSKSK